MNLELPNKGNQLQEEGGTGRERRFLSPLSDCSCGAEYSNFDRSCRCGRHI